MHEPFRRRMIDRLCAAGRSCLPEQADALELGFRALADRAIRKAIAAGRPEPEPGDIDWPNVPDTVPLIERAVEAAMATAIYRDDSEDEDEAGPGTWEVAAASDQLRKETLVKFADTGVVAGIQVLSLWDEKEIDVDDEIDRPRRPPVEDVQRAHARLFREYLAEQDRLRGRRP